MQHRGGEGLEVGGAGGGKLGQAVLKAADAVSGQLAHGVAQAADRIDIALQALLEASPGAAAAGQFLHPRHRVGQQLGPLALLGELLAGQVGELLLVLQLLPRPVGDLRLHQKLALLVRLGSGELVGIVAHPLGAGLVVLGAQLLQRGHGRRHLQLRLFGGQQVAGGGELLGGLLGDPGRFLGLVLQLLAVVAQTSSGTTASQLAKHPAGVALAFTHGLDARALVVLVEQVGGLFGGLSGPELGQGCGLRPHHFRHQEAQLGSHVTGLATATGEAHQVGLAAAGPLGQAIAANPTGEAHGAALVDPGIQARLAHQVADNAGGLGISQTQRGLQGGGDLSGWAHAFGASGSTTPSPAASTSRPSATGQRRRHQRGTPQSLRQWTD